jgi:hypothetical protein
MTEIDEDDLDQFEDEPDCDCTEFEVDWEGRATCDHCCRSWWATAEQTAAYERWHAEYWDGIIAEQPPLSRLRLWFWGKFYACRRWIIDTARRAGSRAKGFFSTTLDDGIPF